MVVISLARWQPATAYFVKSTPFSPIRSGYREFRQSGLGLTQHPPYAMLFERLAADPLSQVICELAV
jgi:hypothetical protein